MAQSPQAGRSSRDMRPTAIVLGNARAGGLANGAGQAFASQVAACKGLRVQEIDIVEPDALVPAARRAVEAEPDMILIAGGDGTIRSVAALAGPAGVPLAPLPMGTMNLAPRRLYGERGLDAVLSALPHARPVTWPAGRLNGEMFLLTAVVGFPAAAAAAREESRADAPNLMRMFELAGQAVADGVSGRIRYSGEVSGEGVGLVAALGDLDDIFACRPPAEPCQAFDIVSVEPESLAELISLGAQAWAQGWRSHASLREFQTAKLNVDTDGPVHAMLDGEPMVIEGGAALEFCAHAVRFLSLDEAA
ncbi:MAG: diacylglycerol/lipid kinase family protein [Maricaulaceae bacterium]